MVKSMSIGACGDWTFAVATVEMPLTDITHSISRIAQDMTEPWSNLRFGEESAVIFKAVVV